MKNGVTSYLRNTATRRTVGACAAAVILAMLVVDLSLSLAMDWLQEQFGALTYGSRAWQIRNYTFELLSGMILGISASQLLLAVAYAALGDGHSPRRIIYTTFVLAVFTNVLLLFVMWWYELRWGEVISLFLVPTLLFFLLQIPVWGFRSYFGWTIKSPWSKSHEPQPMRFTVAHLLGWSVFLAVPLCILQGMLSSGSMGFPVLAFCCWGVVLCVLLMGLLYLGLTADFGRWKFLATATMSLLVASATESAAIWLWEGRVDINSALVLNAATFSGGTLLLFCLRLAHRLGYRLLPFDNR